MPFRELLQDRPRDEFSAIVGSQVARCPVDTDEPGELIDNPCGTNASRHVDRQTFTRVLVDNRQALQHLTVGAAIEDEVVSPNVMALFELLLRLRTHPVVRTDGDECL